MKYADIKEFDVANGPGIRVSLFVSGCRHACKGCFNYEAWDFNYGKDYTTETQKYILNLLDRDFIKGISLLGGEPLEPENQKYVAELIKEVKTKLPKKDIWLYTGFTYEQVMNEMVGKLPHTWDIVKNINVMVDGKFDIDLLNLRLQFRGSSNQRLIDMPKSLNNRSIHIYKKE